jgi:rare lipoprotein A
MDFRTGLIFSMVLLLGGLGVPMAASADAADPDIGDPTRIQVGEASYYGDWHQGKPTASGEPFNKNDLTAASTTLPLGTKAKVINIENGRSIVVRVNDRGPYVKNRVIDLSEKAATQIGMKEKGIASVVVKQVPAPVAAK